MIGIIFGVGVSVGIGKLIPWLMSLSFFKDLYEGDIAINPVVTLWSIVVSFFVAVTVGLAFGVYPAIVASRRDPIFALRHD